MHRNIPLETFADEQIQLIEQEEAQVRAYENNIVSLKKRILSRKEAVIKTSHLYAGGAARKCKILTEGDSNECIKFSAKDS